MYTAAPARSSDGRLHRFITRMLLAAMATLALGISAELYTVTHKITASHPLSLTLAALTLALFYTLWFAYTLHTRNRPKIPTPPLPKC